MDYLVFGVGFGSTLVLVGWVLRQFGPTFRYRDTPDDVLTAEQILERNDWQRFCIAMGALLSVCGAVILLVTLITLLIRPSDSVGTIIVGSLFVISLLAVAGWVVMYVNQHRALAGDRRAEVLASKTPRRTSRPRAATSDDATTTDPKAPDAQLTTPSAGASRAGTTNASAGSLEDLERRRRAAQQQQRGAPAPTVQPRPSTRPAQSARPTMEQQEHDDREVEAPAIAEPALRNLQFKRSGNNRPAPPTAATTTTVPPRREAVAEPVDEDDQNDIEA